jgi:hypothetical protein
MESTVNTLKSFYVVATNVFILNGSENKNTALHLIASYHQSSLTNLRLKNEATGCLDRFNHAVQNHIIAVFLCI